MKNFFISFNKADRDWAEWIAWTLEDANYSVVVQTWDFRPGNNFILKMQEAAAETEKTIAVLSEEYLKAEYTQPEWSAALVRDPQGKARRLIPIRVRECKPSGLLKSIIYLDLVNLSESEARNALLGAFSERAKPPLAYFPGKNGSPTEQTQGSIKTSQVPFPAISSGGYMTDQSINTESEEDERGSTVRNSHAQWNDLLSKLIQVPQPQFDIIVFQVHPPKGLIPSKVSQMEQAAAFLNWAGSSGGCGLEKIQEVYDRVVNP